MKNKILFILAFAFPLYAQQAPTFGFKTGEAVQSAQTASIGQTAQDSSGMRDLGTRVSTDDFADSIGVGITSAFAGVLNSRANSSTTNNIALPLILEHATSGAPVGNFGVEFRARGHNNANAMTNMGGVSWRWTSSSSMNSHMRFIVSAAGTNTAFMRLSHTGTLKVGGAMTSDATGRVEFINDSDGAFGDSSAIVTLAGNLGLGTATPSQKIDVVGSVALSGDAVFSAGTLNASSVMAGSNSFATTVASDTVTITGAADTDLYFITLTGTAAPSANDAFRVESTATGFIIRRSASGTSGLTYSWLRLKP